MSPGAGSVSKARILITGSVTDAEAGFRAVQGSLKGGLLGGSGDLASLLSNGPCRAYYGFLWWLIGAY